MVECGCDAGIRRAEVQGIVSYCPLQFFRFVCVVAVANVEKMKLLDNAGSQGRWGCKFCVASRGVRVTVIPNDQECVM